MRESIHRSKQKEVYPQAAQPEAASSGIPNSALEAVMAGKARASSEMMGHRQDLAPSLAAKMSKAFGMDLSQMQLYRTNAMEGTETKGMASGNKIVLSKDIDLNTMAGQAVLGHEISHVRAQSQGIGMGHSGLYQNEGLEHQADVEGMMAARGQSILGESNGMEMGLGMSGIGGLTAMGPGIFASAGAPMQAKDKKKGKKGKSAAIPEMSDKAYEDSAATEDPLTDEEVDKVLWDRSPEGGMTNIINGVQWKNSADDLGFKEWKGQKKENFAPLKWGTDYLESHADQNQLDQWNDVLQNANEKSLAQLRKERELEKNNKKVVKQPKYKDMLGGAFKNRLLKEFAYLPKGSIPMDLVNNMASTDTEKNDLAKKQIKELHFQELLRKEKKWGKLLHQMDIEDLLSKGGAGGFMADICLGLQLADVNEKDGYKFEGKKEARYQQLKNYFFHFSNYLNATKAINTVDPKKDKALWEIMETANEKQRKDTKNDFLNAQKVNGKDVIQNGPSLNEEQLKAYKKSRMKK